MTTIVGGQVVEGRGTKEDEEESPLRHKGAGKQGGSTLSEPCSTDDTTHNHALPATATLIESLDNDESVV